MVKVEKDGINSMEEFINLAKRTISTLDSILEEAWRELRSDEKSAAKRFGWVLVAMDSEATKIFRAYEKRALLGLAKEWLRSQKDDIRERLEKIIAQKGWDDFIQSASQLFAEFGTLVQALEKDLGNMRKARGGKTFEKVILRCSASNGSGLFAN
ncbi:MAG: hypothetical protein ACP5JH_02875 [Bacteroidota bacterium]